MVQYEVPRGEPAALIEQLVNRALEDDVVATLGLVLMVDPHLALKFWARDSWEYSLEVVPVDRKLIWVAT